MARAVARSAANAAPDHEFSAAWSQRASCHSATGRHPLYPALDGQNAPHLESQRRLFRSGNRGGTAYSAIMANAAAQLSVSDLAAVSAYFAASR